MDFRLANIGVPFRMQPGLRRGDRSSARLTPLAPGSALHASKAAVTSSGQALHRVASFDAEPALATLEALAGLTAAPDGQNRESRLALAVEEDFAVLDGGSGRIPWLLVCSPSHWAPEDKVGLDFTALHAPVADNGRILQAAAALVARVTDGNIWHREVWTLSPSGQHDQHPRRQARAPWPTGLDDAAFAANCWLRMEQQTFLPVAGQPGQAIFLIRVIVKPLITCLDDEADARALHASLGTMSPAVLAYKNLGEALGPVRRWLAASYRL